MNHFRSMTFSNSLIFVSMCLLLVGCEPEPRLDDPSSDSGNTSERDVTWDEDSWWDQDIASHEDAQDIHETNDIIDINDTNDREVSETETDIEEQQADHPDFVVVADILRTSCGIAGCHGAIPQGNFQLEGGMDATNDQVRAALENVRTNGNEMLVEPGNAGVSGIYYRLLLENPTDRMPPAPFTALEQEKIDAIADWIDSGAPYEQSE